MVTPNTVIAVFVALCVAASANGQLNDASPKRPKLDAATEALISDVKAKAAVGQWVQAFDAVDAATEKARDAFNKLLADKGQTPDDPRGTLDAEQKIADHFVNKYFPLFQAGYALAVEAQAKGGLTAPAVGPRVAKWALNGKGMHREVIGARLVARRMKTDVHKVQVPAMVPAEDIQKEVPENAALVEIIRFDNFFDNDKPWYGAVIVPGQKGNIQLVDLGEATPTDEQARDLQQAMETEKLADATAALDKLTSGFFQRLHKPVLENAKRWILSPTADIWLVPFSALKVDANTYTIQKHGISYEVVGRNVKGKYGRRVAFKHAPVYVMGLPDVEGPLAATPVFGADSQRAMSASGASTMDVGDEAHSLEFICTANARGSAPGPDRPPGTPLPPPRRPLSPYNPLIGWPRPLAVPVEKGHLLGGELRDTYFNNELAAMDRLPGHITKLATDNFPTASSPIELLDDRAREDSFINEFKEGPGHKTVVLLTHGFFVDPAPKKAPPKTEPRLFDPPEPFMRCGLILTGYNLWSKATPKTKPVTADNRRDGILLGHEVLDHCDFSRTELVCLIGCGTAVGKPIGGDSLASLRYAFTRTGAAAVMGSSWSVQVTSTAELMNSFFRTRFGGDQQPDEVLQQVQVDFIKRKAKSKEAHPLYWAAFSVTR